jgi:hypothetical protein
MKASDHFLADLRQLMKATDHFLADPRQLIKVQIISRLIKNSLRISQTIQFDEKDSLQRLFIISVGVLVGFDSFTPAPVARSLAPNVETCRILLLIDF